MKWTGASGGRLGGSLWVVESRQVLRILYHWTGLRNEILSSTSQFTAAEISPKTLARQDRRTTGKPVNIWLYPLSRHALPCEGKPYHTWTCNCAGAQLGQRWYRLLGLLDHRSLPFADGLTRHNYVMPSDATNAMERWKKRRNSARTLCSLEPLERNLVPFSNSTDLVPT